MADKVDQLLDNLEKRMGNLEFHLERLASTSSEDVEALKQEFASLEGNGSNSFRSFLELDLPVLTRSHRNESTEETYRYLLENRKLMEQETRTTKKAIEEASKWLNPSSFTG